MITLNKMYSNSFVFFSLTMGVRYEQIEQSKIRSQHRICGAILWRTLGFPEPFFCYSHIGAHAATASKSWRLLVTMHSCPTLCFLASGLTWRHTRLLPDGVNCCSTAAEAGFRHRTVCVYSMLEAAGTFWILDVGFRLETYMNEHYISLAKPTATRRAADQIRDRIPV